MLNNELLFLIHLIIVIIATVIMTSRGKEGLISFLCVQAILANLFVIKQITLVGCAATSSDVYIVGSVFSLNLLQEYFGKETARKTIWLSFLLLLFYTIVSQIHICYLPSASDFAHTAYFALFSFMPRLTIASIGVYLAVQYFDTFFYGLLRVLLRNKFLFARNILSITVSQLLDTILFSFFGLYGIIDNLISVALISYSIKIVTMLLLVPSVLAIKKLFKIG